MNLLPVSAYATALRQAKLLVECTLPQGDLPVESITFYSKEAAPGGLFACKGAAFKKAYLEEALQRGAGCILTQTSYEEASSVAQLLVSDVRAAMTVVADLFYDHAWQKLKLIGITGTKGKSTTAYYIKYILDEYLQSIGEKPCAILSSIDVYDGRVMRESHLTTPEAFELHQHFHNAVESGIRYFVMEVSSQALKYDRVLGVTFDSAVFLNISEDHISPIEHSDFEDYFSSKLKLFSQSNLAIVNCGTDHAKRILEAAQESPLLVRFGIYADADICGYDVKKEGADTCFKVRTPEFDEDFCLTMPGLFNVENALAAIAVCRRYDIPLSAMQEGLRKARSSGRMEVFQSSDASVIAIVDYAHNKLSFEKLYQSTAEEYPGRKIVTVFGCPGGKALNRRTELGEVAGRYSDRVYLTAEDPGTEAVDDISREIESHIANPECRVTRIDDRAEAIQTAIAEAEPNTIVLITGKGCETYQKIGTSYLPYKPDSYWAAHALKERDAARTLESV